MAESKSIVLNLPELLQIIFAVLSREPLSYCARVCKTWSAIALSQLWRELDSVFPLLQLLGDFRLQAPLWRPRGSQAWMKPIIAPTKLTLSAIPSDKHWERFEVYASIVTKLCISNYPCYDKKPYFTRETPVHFDETLVDMIVNGQDRTCLLPNITSLHVDVTKFVSILPISRLFLGRLKRLELTVNAEPRSYMSWNPLKLFLDNVRDSSPYLECLRIKGTPGADTKWSAGSHPHHSELNEVMQDFLCRLQPSYLLAVEINSTMLTPGLFEILSKFPRLRSIKNSGRRMYLTPMPLKVSSPVASDAFPELKHLFMPIPSQAAEKAILNLQPVLSHLTSLSIACRDYASPSTLRDVFIALSQACPLLSSLQIIACTSKNTVGGKRNLSPEWIREFGDEREQRLRCLRLDPLFRLTRLTELTLLLDFVLPIDDGELEHALRDRKVPFEVLQLSWNPRRIELDQSRLTIGALRIVAQHCPCVRILSLYINVDTENACVTAPPPSFACLEELNLGLSSIAQAAVQATGERLFSLFQDKALPTISVSLHTGNFSKCQFDALYLPNAQENRKRWERVAQLFYRMRGEKDVVPLRQFARSEGRSDADET